MISQEIIDEIDRDIARRAKLRLIKELIDAAIELAKRLDGTDEEIEDLLGEYFLNHF